MPGIMKYLDQANVTFIIKVDALEGMGDVKFKSVSNSPIKETKMINQLK